MKNEMHIKLMEQVIEILDDINTTIDDLFIEHQNSVVDEAA